MIKRIRPTSSGRFRTTIAGPPSSLAATYRFATRVRSSAHDLLTPRTEGKTLFDMPDPFFTLANAGLPGTATWMLGLLVGINLVMTGVAVTMAAVCVRRMADAMPR